LDRAALIEVEGVLQGTDLEAVREVVLHVVQLLRALPELGRGHGEQAVPTLPPIRGRGREQQALRHLYLAHPHVLLRHEALLPLGQARPSSSQVALRHLEQVDDAPAVLNGGLARVQVGEEVLVGGRGRRAVGGAPPRHLADARPLLEGEVLTG